MYKKLNFLFLSGCNVWQVHNRCKPKFCLKLFLTVHASLVEKEVDTFLIALQSRIQNVGRDLSSVSCICFYFVYMLLISLVHSSLIFSYPLLDIHIPIQKDELH